MNRILLGLMLSAGLCCMFACLGSKEEEPEPAAEAEAPAEVDQRHQQRIDAMTDERHIPQNERVDDTGVNVKAMERVGSEEGAAYAATEFVTRFVRLKHRVRGAYLDPIMKYYPETEEWSSFGVLQGKDPRMPRYTVECLVHLNQDKEWECRLMRIDKKQVYAKDIPDPDVTLPNIRTAEDGTPLRNSDDIADTEEGDSEETPEQAANRKADGDLRMAKTLINRSPDKAKQRLQEIIDDFPGTPAAEEAGELIKTIKD